MLLLFYSSSVLFHHIFQVTSLNKQRLSPADDYWPESCEPISSAEAGRAELGLPIAQQGMRERRKNWWFLAGAIQRKQTAEGGGKLEKDEIEGT